MRRIENDAERKNKNKCASARASVSQRKRESGGEEKRRK